MSDKEKRRKIIDKILEKEDETKQKINTKVLESLGANSEFRNNMSKSIVDYYNSVIDKNIEQVIIPIE